jgi:hypothetical protein
MRTRLAGLLRVRQCWAGLALLALGAAPGPVAPGGGWTDADAWAWTRLQAGATADFNAADRCGSAADPADATDPRWRDACRAVSARFVGDVLTRAPWRDALPRQGFQLVGAHIAENIDLSFAAVDAQVAIGGSRIEGGLTLEQTGFRHGFVLGGSHVAGSLNADGLRADNLLLRNGTAIDGDLVLDYAEVARNIDLQRSTFGGRFSGEALHVRQSLLLDDSTFRGPVDLDSAAVDGNLEMDGATLMGDVSCDGLLVKQGLFLHGTTLKAKLDLQSAQVDNSLEMDGGSFATGFNGDSLRVGAYIFMNNAHFGGPVDLTFARINGDIDVRDSDVVSLDLSETDIAQGLRLGGGGEKSVRWTAGADGAPSLTLRDAHAAELQDSAAAWPPALQVDLIGFTYGRIVGASQEERDDRSADWWADWLRRGTVPFNPQPYTQLASVMTAAGDRDSAAAIQFAAQERQRAEASGWRSWLWMSAQCWIVGYGIGDYTFRVVLWVLGFTVLGMLVLLTARSGRARGPVWCLGASLSQLLPVIELNEEFKEFFHDPERKNLTGWHLSYFAVQTVIGWVLASFLVAALGGLMPKG